MCASAERYWVLDDKRGLISQRADKGDAIASVFQLMGNFIAGAQIAGYPGSDENNVGHLYISNSSRASSSEVSELRESSD